MIHFFHIHNIFFIGHCNVDNFNLESDILFYFIYLFLIYFFFVVLVDVHSVETQIEIEWIKKKKKI